MKIWSRRIAQNKKRKNWKILPGSLGRIFQFFRSYFGQSFWNFLTFIESSVVSIAMLFDIVLINKVMPGVVSANSRKLTIKSKSVGFGESKSLDYK